MTARHNPTLELMETRIGCEADSAFHFPKMEEGGGYRLDLGGTSQEEGNAEEGTEMIIIRDFFLASLQA